MRILIFFLFLFSLHAEQQPTICLNMIVKDESQVIRRCLESVKPITDYWVIVDTGSTDGTQEIIRTLMQDIPGELHERPWVHFGHNRNEALQLAKDKGDYVFFIDADETLCLDKNFVKPSFDKDWYTVEVRDLSTGATPLTFTRMALLNNHLRWEWRDIIHEYLQIPPEAKTMGSWSNASVSSGCDGNRSKDPKKYYKDAELLKKALEKEPHNTRYAFYLAQSYSNAKEYELAIEHYLKRAAMQGGWEEEAFWSFFCAAKLQQALKYPPEQFVSNYYKAFAKDPRRAEPLFELAQYFFHAGNVVLSYILTKHALTLPQPQTDMYVEAWIYQYGLSALCADFARHLGYTKEAQHLYEQILQEKTLPDDARRKIAVAIASLPKAP
jgi:glycosyltransferase involved in cell wall biosynthesis